MSRMPVRTFLSTAKKQLQQAIKQKSSAQFVVGNESADLDSITCAIVYGYLQSGTHEALRKNEAIIPVANLPAADLKLRPELTAVLKHASIEPSDLITLDDLGPLPLPLEKTTWTLVDHNSLTGELGKHYSGAVVGVIDHHEDEKSVPQGAAPRIIEKSGSCNSLMINYLRDTWEHISDSLSTNIGASHGQDDKLIDDQAYTTTWDAQVAKLSLASILIDTYNMKEKDKVTEHDKKAVRYLEAKVYMSRKLGKDYDRDKFFDEINTAKSHLDDLSLIDILRKDYKQWTESDLILGTSASVKPLKYLVAKDGDFVENLAAFAKARKLPLFSVMTAFQDDAGELTRELLLLATAEGPAIDAAKRFVKDASEELQLEDSDVDVREPRKGVAWIHAWNQKNRSASRKRVAPLLRQAMRA